MNIQSAMGAQKSQECLLFWANWRMSSVLKDEKKQAQTTPGLGKEKGYLTMGGQEELDSNEKIMCFTYTHKVAIYK